MRVREVDDDSGRNCLKDVLGKVAVYAAGEGQLCWPLPRGKPFKGPTVSLMHRWSARIQCLV